MLYIRGEFAVNTQIDGPKMNRWTVIFVTILSVMIVFSSFAIAAYADRAEGMKCSEATGTSSFGTEDWVGSQEQATLVAMETSSFGTEDWVEDMQFSEVLVPGAIPAPDCK